MLDALAEHGITAYGSSGLGVWVPLAGQTGADIAAAELDIVQQLRALVVLYQVDHRYLGSVDATASGSAQVNGGDLGDAGQAPYLP